MVYRVEKSSVDKLIAQKPLDFSLLSTSPFAFPTFHTLSHSPMTRDLTAATQEVNSLDSDVVVQELELALNQASYGLL